MVAFKAGDVVRCKSYIPFSDGTAHFIGQKITIKEEELAYFNHSYNNHNYELIVV